MAFQSKGPVMLGLPPFWGFTRRIVLTAVFAWLAEIVLAIMAGRYSAPVVQHLMLQPGMLAHGMVWQVVTYPFLGMGLFGLILGLVTIWFFGSRLENDHGTRWFTEFFFASAIGGAVLATVICYVFGQWVDALNPAHVIPTSGMWPAMMAITVAYAWFYPEEKIRMMIVLPVKAKIVAVLYLAFYLFTMRWSVDKFGALVVLTNALCGWMFLKWVPRRGLKFAASEKWFGMRNAFHRNKRKRAAKDFQVYMRKQGKDVHVHDPHTHDPKDKKWMN